MTLTAIGETMPAAVKALADRAAIKPNVLKMHDAIDRWIKEANTRGEQAGIDYLARCSATIERNRQNLADWATDRAPLMKGLDGVTIDDIDAADERITRAARRLAKETV
ncbi:MAG: hypothetical protein IOB84_07895 [Brevundimonas sp.]|nr:hypothetical protein [Brevundimonas sp.]